jgi:hypothetical protein
MLRVNELLQAGRAKAAAGLVVGERRQVKRGQRLAPAARRVCAAAKAGAASLALGLHRFVHTALSLKSAGSRCALQSREFPTHANFAPYLEPPCPKRRNKKIPR